MPQRDFVIWLDHGMYITVDFATAGPVMLSFVVRLVLAAYVVHLILMEWS